MENITLIYILALLCSCWISTESAATLLRRPNQVLGLETCAQQQGGRRRRQQQREVRRRVCSRARQHSGSGRACRSARSQTTCGLTARDHWRPQTRRVLCTTTPWRDYFAITQTQSRTRLEKPTRRLRRVRAGGAQRKAGAALSRDSARAPTTCRAQGLTVAECGGRGAAFSILTIRRLTTVYVLLHIYYMYYSSSYYSYMQLFKNSHGWIRSQPLM